MPRFLIAVLAALTASPASALSCIAPDVVQYYLNARNAAEPYSIVVGDLVEGRQRLTLFGGKRWSARLTGLALGPDGFTVPYESEITVQSDCWGEYCGGPALSGHVLAFLAETGDGPVLETNPCSDRVIYNPVPDAIERLVGCHTTGACGSP
jgi:hypothetical protein